MDLKFVAVVAKSQDHRENDKKISLITPLGAKQAVMRGVKKPKARLRFAAMPFAFCEYTVAEKNGFYTVTGASQIQDLFEISSDTDRLCAGSIILESALAALKTSCETQFVYMLRRLNEVLFACPYIAATRFLQYIIHDAGYGYKYEFLDSPPTTPIQLLAVLSFLDEAENAGDFDSLLVKKTLIKLIDNFEKKFETTLVSKNFLSTL